MNKSAAYLLIVSCLLCLPGCGTHSYETETNHLSTKTFLDESELQMIDVFVESAELDISKKSVVVRFSEKVSIPEKAYDLIEEKTRSKKDPDLIMGALGLAVSPVGILLGDFEMVGQVGKDLVGDTGEWSSNVEKKNLRKTGRNEVKLRREHVSGYVECVLNEKIDHAFRIENGKAVIDISEMARQLMAKPENILLTIKAYQDNADNSEVVGKKPFAEDKLQLDQSQVENLNLYSIRWLSPEEQVVKRLAMLEKSHKANDYSAVVEHFLELENLQEGKAGEIVFINEGLFSGPIAAE